MNLTMKKMMKSLGQKLVVLRECLILKTTPLLLPIIRAESSQSLKNLDGRIIKQEEAFDFEKEFKRRKNDYLKSVTANNSFIKAKLDFDITAFLDE